ncbi:MAG TPA: hypothetical protein VNQ14_05630 [Woeseiaceae bacterium]|nr:hypothetical protein [Woeseiaceae bacterium]
MQLGRRNAQQLGGAGDVATGPNHRQAYRFVLSFLADCLKIEGRLCNRFVGQPHVRSGHMRPLGHDDGAFGPVLEFTHVAGPVVTLYRIFRIRAEPPQGAFLLSGDAREELACQHETITDLV